MSRVGITRTGITRTRVTGWHRKSWQGKHRLVDAHLLFAAHIRTWLAPKWLADTWRHIGNTMITWGLTQLSEDQACTTTVTLDPT